MTSLLMTLAQICTHKDSNFHPYALTFVVTCLLLYYVNQVSQKSYKNRSLNWNKMINLSMFTICFLFSVHVIQNHWFRKKWFICLQLYHIRWDTCVKKEKQKRSRSILYRYKHIECGLLMTPNKFLIHALSFSIQKRSFFRVDRPYPVS